MRVGLSNLAGLGDCLMYDDSGNCTLQGSTTPSPGITQGDCAYGTDANGVCLPYVAPVAQPSYTTTPGSSIVSTTTTPAATGQSWEQILANAAAGLSSNIGKVYATRNAVPQLNPGESITQLANGTYQVTQQPAGVAATGGSLSVSSGLTGSLPLLLMVGLGAFLLLKGGR